jgi:hypothetical protein
VLLRKRKEQNYTMSNITSRGSGTGEPDLTMICDSTGELLAIAGGSPTGWLPDLESSLGRGEDGEWRAKRYLDVFGPASDLTRWITAEMQEARSPGYCGARSDISHNGNAVQVRLEVLRGSGGLFGYALHLTQGPEISEEATLVDRQQWHDIKNHLGGLKLYATFLKKKIPDGENLQIVEKLLNGINSLIEELARIRRGDAT